jgi:flagellar basal-body rod protein FlgB
MREDVMTGIVSFDKEARALQVCESRASLIARNIANSNTPNYKAQDLNFQEAMNQVQSGGFLQGTHANHITMATDGNDRLYYRVPMQYKTDENTVDDEIERKNFLQNALRYQASLGFAERKAAQLLKAIRGE